MQQPAVDQFVIEPAPVAKRIEIVRKGRHYEIPGTGEQFPSVTNILNATPKPALVNWAANKERELCIEAAANLYEDAPVTVKMSRPGYISTLKERLGKQKAHRKELDKAAEIGSKVHERIEWGLRKELLDKASEIGDERKMPSEPVLQGKALWAFMAWEDWRKTVDLEPIWIEQVVWSATHRYAGTLDLYAEFAITDKLIESLPDDERKKIGDYRGTRQRCVCDWKSSRRLYGESILQSAAYVKALIEMGHAEAGCWGLIVRLPKMENDPEFETRFVLPDEISESMQVFLHVQKVWEWMNE
jgi:hypothetical protein